MVQVALGWLLSREAVPAVTPGATTPEQVEANAAAAEWEPTSEDLVALDEAVGNMTAD
jgi:aryl-alcohol dehydrogenase-like predicted oxidoreductase